ncbi:MAG: undecaprenyl/decaprenyl-phosphate alpha-N-acetylglucosaminyl 1-phosphate transferase [Bacteriovoracaceae bacterium]|jgi:UDP-N-acetylmuramyl pentapeptide phosphotransferase/UDP-N-acetylglucosamine-1-phosphate transferase|nr:undecaprenyl/decaprenyl-phosphate alpha-N-acetylglucosaminyl 1-phosphate transferase [Bacteriovoracaceae bacterium]
MALCFFAIPRIINVCVKKDLFDKPNKRKSHNGNIPSLGGVAIFIGFIFTICFWATQKDIVELQYIISSLLLLFFTGIRDDIIPLKAFQKLIIQIICSGIIIWFTDIHLTSFYGLFGIYHIPKEVGYPFTLITIIAITNAFNLIDGINTHAATQGIFALTCYGVWFYLTGHSQYSILSFSMIGALLGFLYFNKTPAKIFMGDTGSLVLGFTIAILTIKFIEFNRSYYGDSSFRISSVPAIAISILIIPIFDTLRVFTIRTLTGKSPFNPDRNHLHHILVDKKLSHEKSSAILLLITFLITLSSMILKDYISGESILCLSLISIMTLTFFLKKI